MIANEKKINYFLAAINISIAMNLLTVNLLRKLLAHNEEDFLGGARVLKCMLAMSQILMVARLATDQR